MTGSLQSYQNGSVRRFRTRPLLCAAFASATVIMCMGQSCADVPTPADEQVLAYQPDNPNTSTDSTTSTADKIATEAPAPRTLSMAASTWSGKPPLAVAFTASTVEGGKTPTGLAWDFGDGSTASGSRAQHSFKTAGSYKVTLCPGSATPFPETLTCAQGIITVTTTTTTTSGGTATTATPAPRTLRIIASRWTGSAPFPIAFSASTVEGGSVPTGLQWDFGDGGTAVGSRVQHTFATAGNYTVRLCPGSTTAFPQTLTCAQGVAAILTPGSSVPVDTPVTDPTQVDPTTGSVDPGTGTDTVSTPTDGGTTTPAINHAPSISERGLTVRTDVATNLELIASDPDSDALSYIITQLPPHNTLSYKSKVLSVSDLPYVIPGGDRFISYNPQLYYQGRDDFAFAVTDGKETVTGNYYVSTNPSLTMVPAITSARWTAPVALPSPTVVTKANYLDYITRYYLNDRGTYTRPRAGLSTESHQQDSAFCEGFFYHITSDDEYARWALLFFHGSYDYYTIGDGKAEVVRFDAVAPAVQAYLWIRNSAALTSTDHAFIRQYLLLLDTRQEVPWELGSFSRAVVTAMSRYAIGALYPDDAGAPARLAYGNQIWNDFWQYRDGTENSGNYTTQWLFYMAQFISLYNPSGNVYGDSAVQALVQRFMNQASPMGLMPEYGDNTGPNTNPGQWISFYEMMANVYRDGRYKYLAHRIFEWTHARESDMAQWGNIATFTMSDMIFGYLAADDTIAEVVPQTGSMVTTRHAQRWWHVGDTVGYPSFLQPQIIPDKLVLRSGWNPADMFAMVELAPQMGHGHFDAASINCMTAGGSVLLGTPGYLLREQMFHNCFQVFNAQGNGTWDSFGKPEVATTVPVFKDGSLATYAQVHVEGYNFAPATLDRRVFFVKNQFTWVRDTITATSTLNAGVGPAWNTVSTYGPTGTDWVNTCFVTLPCAPVYDSTYLMQWRNHPHDLLVKFLPNAQSQVRIDDVTWDTLQTAAPQTLMNTMRLRVWQRKDVQLTSGNSLTFSSLLVPHAPEADSTVRAAAYTAVVDNAGASVVRFDESGTAAWYIGINDSGGSLVAGPLTTDAKWFVVRVVNNAVTQYDLFQATNLRLNASTVWSNASRIDVELVN